MHPTHPASCGRRILVVAVILAVVAAGCHRSHAPDGVPGRRLSTPSPPQPTAPPLPDFEVDAVSTQEGDAAWYDVPEHSLAQRRAWPDEMTAASDTIPVNTYVRVRRPGNGKSVILRITDHGIHQKGTIVDVDRAAAEALGMVKAGRVRVKLEVLALKNADAAGPSPASPTPSLKQPGASAAEEKAAAQSKGGGDSK